MSLLVVVAEEPSDQTARRLQKHDVAEMICLVSLDGGIPSILATVEDCFRHPMSLPWRKQLGEIVRKARRMYEGPSDEFGGPKSVQDRATVV